MNNNITKQKYASNLVIILVITFAVYNIFFGVFCYVVGGMAGLIFGASMMLVGGIMGAYYRNKQNQIKLNYRR